MSTKQITTIEKHHVKLLIDRFSPTDPIKARWKYFYEKQKATYWTGIDVWKFWEYDSKKYKKYKLDNTNKIFLNERIIIKYKPKIKEIVLVAVGNSNPQVETLSLGELNTRYPIDLPIEYFLSILPGKLIIVTNHNGETLFLEQ